MFANAQEQPAARRANIDFERSERERIHFETATRVMNYQIQADRKKLAEGVEPAETRRMPRMDVSDDLYEDDDFQVRGWRRRRRRWRPRRLRRGRRRVLSVGLFDSWLAASLSY